MAVRAIGLGVNDFALWDSGGSAVLVAVLAGTEMPKTFVGRQERADDRLPAVGARRYTQKNHLQRLEQVAGHRQLAFVASVVERHMVLLTVTEPETAC